MHRAMLRVFSRTPLRSSLVQIFPGIFLKRVRLAYTSSHAPPEVDFHKVADDTLECIELSATALEDSVEGFDLSLAMGVLTINLGPKGTYVLNKQAPNKQIWWSSPVSGPRRYTWEPSGNRWVNTRDGHEMLGALETELSKLLGKELKISKRLNK